MVDRIKWKRSGAVSKVLNEHTTQKFVISTARNPYGVWETAIFGANEMFFPFDLTNPLLVMNAPNREETEEQHIQAAIAFQTKEPSELIRQYELEDALPLGQLLYSESEQNITSDKLKSIESEVPNQQETVSKYHFWSEIQKISLFLFLIFLVMCFIWSWFLLIPALLFLSLNLVAYSNRMKSLGRDPATRDVDEVS